MKKEKADFNYRVKESKDFNRLRFSLYKFLNINPNGKKYKDKINNTKMDLNNPFDFIVEDYYDVNPNDRLVDTKCDLDFITCTSKHTCMNSELHSKLDSIIDSEIEPKSVSRKFSLKDLVKSLLNNLIFGSDKFYNKRVVPKIISVYDLIPTVIILGLTLMTKYKYNLFGSVFIFISVVCVYFAFKTVYLSLRVYLSKYLNFDVFVILLGWLILFVIISLLSFSIPMKPFLGSFEERIVIIKSVEVTGNNSCSLHLKSGDVVDSVYPIGEKRIDELVSISNRVTLKYFDFLGKSYFVDFSVCYD